MNTRENTTVWGVQVQWKPVQQICIHFFADPDPAVLLHAESGSSFKKLPYEEFSGVEKDRKGYS